MMNVTFPNRVLKVADETPVTLKVGVFQIEELRIHLYSVISF